MQQYKYHYNIIVSNTNNIPCIKNFFDKSLSVYIYDCMLKDGSLTEELEDILAGLEQRIMMYRSKLIELQKKRDRLDDELKTAKRYLELAETLYKVEKNKSRTSQQGQPGLTTVIREHPKSSDDTKDLLLNQFIFSGLSYPRLPIFFKGRRPALHAKYIYQASPRRRSKNQVKHR